MNSTNQPPKRTPFEIFNGALDLPDSAELKAYLDYACQGDAALRAQVENLLAHHRSDSFLEHAPLGDDSVGEAPTTLDPRREATPARVAPLVTIKYFGDYELLEELARGGMGVVYKARQKGLNRIVAVKMILSGQLASEVDVKRFRSEAEAAANLQHPNIVAIHEVGEHEGRHYFSMDYVEGKDLASLVKEGPLPPAMAAQLVKTISEAIHYAHQRGVLHRDLKPQNVLMDEHDCPRVTDFGLAKRTGADSSLTQTGAVMGSPSYMPPEQAAGRHDQVGPHSDVYSLGAILYQLLAGQPPFQGETALATLHKVVEEEATSPSKLNPRVPEDLETICLKCLEKRPDRRYATACALAEELGRFLNQEPILAKPASAWRHSWSWSQRNPWAITGAAALLILGLIAFAYGLWEQTQYLRWTSTHPQQVKPHLSNLFDSFTLGAWMPFLAVFAGMLTVASLQDRKRLEPATQRRLMQAYCTVGVGEMLIGTYLVVKWIHANTWEIPSVWYRSNFTVLPAFTFFWFGTVLVWHVIRERQAARFGEGVAVDQGLTHLVDKKQQVVLLSLFLGGLVLFIALNMSIPGGVARWWHVVPWLFLSAFCGFWFPWLLAACRTTHGITHLFWLCLLVSLSFLIAFFLATIFRDTSRLIFLIVTALSVGWIGGFLLLRHLRNTGVVK